jgi:hypothetical protein
LHGLQIIFTKNKVEEVENNLAFLNKMKKSHKRGITLQLFVVITS